MLCYAVFIRCNGSDVSRLAMWLLLTCAGSIGDRDRFIDTEAEVDDDVSDDDEAELENYYDRLVG